MPIPQSIFSFTDRESFIYPGNIQVGTTQVFQFLSTMPISFGIADNVSGAAFVKGMAIGRGPADTGYIPASNASLDTQAIGLACEPSEDGTGAIVQLFGPFCLLDWTAITGTVELQPRTTYYLGTNGLLTPTPPAGPAIVQRVGYSISPFVLNLSPALVPSSGGGGSGSVTSQEVSAISNALSVETAARIAADNALSAAINVVSNTLSVEVSNRVSADNALSNAISVVSNALSVEISNRQSADSTLSTAISNLRSVVSHVSAKANFLGASVQGLQGVINTLSNNASIISQALSVTGVAVGNEVSNRTSAVNVVSNALSNEISNRNSAVNVVSNAASNALSVANAASNAASVVSNALSVETANRISADNALSNAISIVSNAASNAQSTANAASNAVSVLSAAVANVSARSVGNVSTKGLQSVINALSNRISASGGGTGSVTSTELSAVSAQAASAINVVSNALSVETSNRISADNAISVFLQGISARSATVSTHGLQSVIDVLSNGISTLSNYVCNQVSALSSNGTAAIGIQKAFDALSNRISIVSNAVSVETSNRTSADNVISNAASHALSVANAASNAASNALSVANAASNAASIVSNALSNEISNRTSAVNVLSNQVSILSNQVSNLISASPQIRRCTSAVTISASALTNVSGLSVSVAAGGTYYIDGMLVFTVSAPGGVGFGMTFPAMAQAGGFMGAVSAFIQGGGTTRVGFTGSTASGSILVSVSAQASAQVNPVEFNGLFVVSTAGTIQIQARVCAAASNLVVYQNSFIRAIRIN